MSTSVFRTLVVSSLLLVALAALWVPSARSQINASPSWVPIGVSASGSNSTVWFHEASTRQAVACQTVNAPGSGTTSIHCIAGKLP